MTNFVTRTFDRLENGVRSFEARLGEAHAENYLWALVVGLLAGLPNGCFAITAIILTEGPPLGVLETGFWGVIVLLTFSTPFLWFFTKSWWKALRSSTSLAFGLFTGIAIPVLCYWMVVANTDQVKMLGAVAVLMAICIWLFEGTNPRLDQMEAKDRHHIGPSV